MADLDLSYSLQNRKRKLSWNERANYGIILLPVMLVVLCSIAVYYSFTDDSSLQAFTNRGYLSVAFLGIAAGIVFFFVTIRRLRQNADFSSIATPWSAAENYQKIIEIYQQTNVMVKQHPGYIVCRYGWSLLSWGEEVTLIPLDNEILINSHPLSAPVTMVKDARNIKWFENQIKALMTLS